jgi:hypothetical protein
MKSILITFLLSALFTAQAQSFKDKLQKKKDSLEKVTKDKLNAVSTTSAAPKLTNEEVIRGLKEALSVGTNSASSLAGKTDGFLKNTRLFIPWPEEAKDMKAKLTTMGFTKKISACFY